MEHAYVVPASNPPSSAHVAPGDVLMEWLATPISIGEQERL